VVAGIGCSSDGVSFVMATVGFSNSSGRSFEPVGEGMGE
jgi:hypothetical protein